MTETKQQPRRKPWQKMSLHYAGNIDRLVQRGLGKLSGVGGDPGEPRKQKPTG